MSARKRSAASVSTVEGLAAASGVSVSVLQNILGREPRDEFPGHATIDPRGARIARQMLRDLNAVSNDGSATASDDACLANWPRKGRPFRNVVAEYAAKASAVSPQALEAFYAVLSDWMAWTCQGSVPHVSNYNKFCRRGQGRTGRARREVAR